MFRNGRFLLLAAAAYVVAAATLGIAWFWPDSEPYEPLGNYSNPQQIISEKTVPVGGSIMVTARKCNLSDEPVSVTGTAYFRREESATRYVGLFTGTKVFEPGCITRDFENQLPPAVTPGTWVIAGWDEARRGEEVQTLGWETEPFEVVP